METNFKPKKSDNITVKYHGELMENFFSESTIDSGQGLRAIKYEDDLAMLLFIDRHHKLRLIVQIDNSASGWTSYDLSPNQREVSAFDIHHDETNNTLKIAYSAVSSGSSQMLLSDELNLSNLEPKSLTQILKWNSIELNNVTRKIDLISMNQSGLLFSTGYRDRDATYSYFRYGENPQDYTLPENTSKVVQLEVGQFDSEFGVFLLYEMKTERTMLFQSFPDKYGEVTQHRFKPSNELCGFTTVDDRDGNDKLYLSGDGIFIFKMEDGEMIPTQSTVCDSGGDVIFSKIEVSANRDETAIWTIGEVNGRSGLYYLTNKFYESAERVNTSKWTAPLQMQNDIEEFSCIKGNAFSNQLFLLGSDENTNTLIHFWQDEKTTSWQEHPVVLQDLEEIRKLETFTVNVEFKSDVSTLSFCGEKINISAEANLLVYINESKVAIGPNQSYEIIMKDNYINIVYPTKSVAASLLYLEADFLPSKATIDPAHKLKGDIEVTFCDQDELKNAKLPNGEPLIDSSVSDSDLEQVVNATNQAYKQIEQLNDDSSNSVNSSAVFAVAAPTTSQSLGSSILSDVGNALGDIWHSVKKGFVQITEFVVETVKDGVKFVIKIGTEVFEWVSKAVSDVFHFLECIWEKVKVFFKDMFEYLGFLFSWNDILRSKRVMKQYLSNIIIGLADELENIRQKTYQYFDEVKDKIEDIKKEIDFKQLNDRDFNELTTSNTNNDEIDPRADCIKTKTHYITNSQAQRQVASAVPSDSLNTVSSASARLIELFEDLGQQFAVAFSDLWEKFLAVIDGKMKIGDFLEYFVLTLLEMGVAVAQEIIDLIFQILEVAIISVDKILNASINIPFFSSLYKLVSGGDDLSVNDLVCLLIAIPMTVLYKIGEGEAPFENSGEEQNFIDSGKSIFTLDYYKG